MPLSILCSVSSVAGIKSKSIPGVITAASFVLPTALGSISIQGITGTYTSFTVSRTGGGLANFTSTIQNFPTNSFTDPTALNNNSQYTYTITPTNNGVAGTTFSAITNTRTGLSNGLIYSLASAPTLTYNGAGSSTSAISFTFTGGSYTNLSVQFPSGTFIATTTVSPYTGGSFGANTQNTYYVFAINGDNYGGLTAVGTGTNVAASSTSVNVCTWASAPTLSYNGAGSSTSAISFTYSGGTFNSLSIQTTLGSQIDTSTVSPYTSPSIYSINQQITYYACPVNALGYYSTSTNYASVNVCTWASAPTLSYNGAGSSTSAISFTYSGGTFNSLSIQTTLGSQIDTSTVSPYTSPSIYSINQQITYYACPVNALGYYSTSTNYASVSVCTQANIIAAVFVTPSVLGRIFNGTSTLTGITGTFTSYILTRTGGSQGTYTLSGQSGSTVTDTTTGLTNNTAYTYTLTPVNQLNYNGTVFTSITGSTTAGIIYTLASATMTPTLVNASGSATSVYMSWTNTGYSSIRIQNTTTSGTISTYTTGSGTTTYNSNSVSALSTNTQYTYTFTAVNGDGNFLVGTTSTTLGTCTWASCNAPTFASTTSTGTTLTDTGTFSKVLINYSGGTASPASGTTVTGTNTVTQAYTTMASSTPYTFVCFPVNALNYQSSNSASAAVTTSAGGATFGTALFNSGGRISSIGTNTANATIGTWAISTGGKVVLYFIGNVQATATGGGTNQVYMNDGNFGTTFTNINSKLANFWTGTGGKVLAIGVTNDGTRIVIFMYYTGTAGNTATASASPAWYVATNGTSGSSGVTFTLYTGATGTVSFLGPGQGQCVFSSDNNWCFATPLNGNYNQSFYRNTTAGNFTAWTGYLFSSGNGPIIAPFCLNSNASIMYCCGGWFGGTTLMKSTNTGVAWSQIASGVLSTGYATNCVGCDSTGNIVYCTTLWTGAYTSRMYKSTNTGTTWAEVTLPFGTGNWVSWFVVDSTGNNIVLLNGGTGGSGPCRGNGINPTTVTGLYISTNGGTSWSTTTGYPTTYNPSYPSGIFADSTFTVFGLCTSSSSAQLASFGMLTSIGVGRLF